MQFKPGMYVGIDLGTTNTVLSRCLVDPHGDLLAPKTIPIAQQTDELGNIEEREKLCSSIFVDEEGQMFPGEYAQKRLMSRQDAHDVIAWWKNDIGLRNKDGELRTWEIHHRQIDAKQAASCVLKHIRKQFEEKYPGVRVAPVITVPASFPEQMKQATLEAAYDAGWFEEKQSPILLYEPIAALIAYLSWYESEQMPLPPEKRSPDLQQGGRLLVFDIGGGTVDVTIARIESFLFQGQTKMRAYVEDYAPHTLLGGYRFDTLFADGALCFFCKENGISPEKLPQEDRDSLYGELIEWSEKAKISLSSGQSSVSRRLNIPPSLRGPDGKRIATLTVEAEDYKQYISPLLGGTLSLNSVLPKSETRHIGEAETIVEPIIRLMQRHQLRPTDLAGCLLVGGMTYLPALRERLEHLFEYKTPLIWGQIDPLNAVAYGAAIHNAQVLNGVSPHMAAIRPVELLVHQQKTRSTEWVAVIEKDQFLTYGESLHKQSPTLLFPRGQREISLRFRYGGIQRRGLKFSYPEELTSEQERAFVCKLSVDSRTHILRIHAYLLDFPDVKLEVDVDETPQQAEEVAEPLATFPPSLATKVLPPRHLPPAQDPELNRQSKDLGKMLRWLKSAKDSHIASTNRKEIEKSSHAGMIVPDIVAELKNNEELSIDGKTHMVLLVGRLYERYTYGNAINPQTSKEVADKMKGALPQVLSFLQGLLLDPYAHATMRQNAAVALGFAGLWNTSLIKTPKLLNMIEGDSSKYFLRGSGPSIKTEILRAIGRTLHTQEDWYTFLRSWCKQGQEHVALIESACWAIARILTREPLLLKQTDLQLVEKTLSEIKNKALTHDNPSARIMGWNAVALFSMTHDIGLERPIYEQSAQALLDWLFELANKIKNSPKTSSIWRNVDFFLRAAAGQKMAEEMAHELESLPVLR